MQAVQASESSLAKLLCVHPAIPTLGASLRNFSLQENEYKDVYPSSLWEQPSKIKEEGQINSAGCLLRRAKLQLAVNKRSI